MPELNWPREKQPDINDTLCAEGVDAVRERSDRAQVYKRPKPAGKGEPEPLPYIDLSVDPKPRSWFVRDKIPSNNVTLLSGEGGRGKSLLALQVCGAAALGRDWIGMLPELGPSIYLGYEDDDDEIRHRLDAVAGLYGVSRKQLADNLHASSMVGHVDSALASFDRSGKITPTKIFDRLHKDALRLQPKVIVLDSSADVFPGNEIDRRQTRQFITLLRHLSIDVKAATILISHPSLTGIASGSGLSGTTAWHNSTRARAYLKTFDESKDSDLRVLEFKKANYSALGESVVLRWRNGVYVPEPRAGSLERLAADAKVDEAFLSLLERFERQGRNVSDRPSPSYAPKLFAEEPEGKSAKISREAFADAMRRLFAENKIHVESYGRPSRPYTRLATGPAQK